MYKGIIHVLLSDVTRRSCSKLILNFADLQILFSLPRGETQAHQINKYWFLNQMPTY